MEQSEKARRKELLRRHRTGQHEDARRRLGLTEAELRSLLEHLEDRSAHDSCDHTLRATERWAREHGKHVEAVAAGVRSFGGHCDCEVLANVEPEAFGWRELAHARCAI